MKAATCGKAAKKPRMKIQKHGNSRLIIAASGMGDVG